MADDAQSTHTRNRRAARRGPRGPLVLTNPDNDSDEDTSERATSRSTWYPPPLPSPTNHSPYSEQGSVSHPSYPSKPSISSKPDNYDQSSTYNARNPSNPSLSSPSGSSSPAVESTPPPSTPGQGVGPSTLLDDTSVVVDRSNNTFVDEHVEARQQNSVPRTSVMERVKQVLRPNHGARSPTTHIGPAFASPTNNTSREPINRKVLLTITTDCDNYTVLDITGARNAPMVREKIYSKLQIPDDQQRYFSVYLTEIGAFATSEALSDERLMEICREEGDSKGSVKLLVQHSSATVHLPPPPPRTLVANHVPPVLPYQESFRSPSSKARSTKSNHDTMSSTSEQFVIDPAPMTSRHDDIEDFDRDNRNTMRPPQQYISPQLYGTAHPSSPLDPRRAPPPNIREPSPSRSRKAMSPARPPTLDTKSPFIPTLAPAERNRIGSVTPTISPNGNYFDDSSITPPPSRRTHTHSASDAAADRERVLEYSERQLSEKDSRLNLRDGRAKQESAKRRGKVSDYPESSKRVQEPWVLVQSPAKERPSTADTGRPSPSMARAVQHTPSASHSGPYSSDASPRYPYSPYSTPRGNLPAIPVAPRGPPPPAPSSASGSNHRAGRAGQALPPNWLPKYLGDENPQTNKSRLYEPPQTKSRLMAAKSMDSLRGNLYPNSGGAANQRKGSQNNLARPSIIGLREAASSSTGSFMNMDPSPSRRDLSTAGIARSYEQSRGNFSPTNYTPTRPAQMNPSQSQGEFVQPPTSQYRPLPMTGQSSASGSTNYLNAPPNQGAWRQSPEDLFPRPHSALGASPDADIGASPAPQRSWRPLPPAGSSGSWVDVESPFVPEDSRSPGISSPHHPYATAGPQGLRPVASGSSNLASLRTAGTSGSTLADSLSYEAPAGLTDSTTAQVNRSSHCLSSPDSPRRTPVENRENSTLPQSGSETPKSFVSIQDSPVYDGDNEAVGTLKGDDRAWAATFVSGNTSSSDGTLKAATKGGRDKPLPNPNSIDDLYWSKESSSSCFKANVDSIIVDDRDDYESDDDDDDDDDDAASLWKTPLKSQPEKITEGKRPALQVNTDNGKPSSTSTARNAYYISPGQSFPSNIPPPNFPPPPPPVSAGFRRQKRNVSGRSGDKGLKADRGNRDSQFIRTSNVTWAFRPPAEEMYERLEEYFPDHDLDQPVIETTSGGSSPTAAEPAAPAFQGSSADKDRKFKHKKSIRVAANEYKRKFEHTSRSDSSSMSSSILRKRSTKLWGSKVEEVTTSHVPNVPALPESPTAANPKPIFKWVRGELIGKGTYGRVYLALNATTGEMIAVKQVEIPKTDADRDDTRQASVVEALKLESETLKDLDHPNIVQYLGFEQTPDFLSIFLEYVPGGSVAGCLRKHGKFDDQVARSFTGQILAGLEYLHNARIIHRDLKADNILVDPSGICKISDFGISKRTADINENGIHTSMQGSVFWMAPEVVQAARKGEQHGYNGKVDIWSLGCVVLEMWAGRRPWQDVDAIAVIYELITKQGAPPVPPDVHLGPEADDFRRKCFAIKPDERPSATELRHHPYLDLQPGWTFTGFR